MSVAEKNNLLPEKGEVNLYPAFFSVAESDRYLRCCLNDIPWEQRPVKLFGKIIPQPRLTASFADPGTEYGYSGVELQSSDWNEELLEIKKRAEAFSGFQFNTALLNLYRDGRDYMGWHRDNEKDLGIDPAIISVSFGVERKFQLRLYKEKTDLITVLLKHGDLLIMKGETQKFWEHLLPKATAISSPRINITFRKVL